MTGTTRLSLPYVVSGQAQGEVPHNDALDKLDARIDATLTVDLSAGNGTASLAAIQQAAVIVGSGATVARNLTLDPFKGYRWIRNTGTAVVSVKVGSTTIDLPGGALAMFSGDGTTNGLAQIGPTFRNIAFDAIDVASFMPGQPGDNAKVIAIVFARAVSFPINFAGSYLKAGAAATADSVYTVKKNGSSIGTITVAASGTTGTFSVASAQSFAAGDVLNIIAPTPQDGTLADVSLTIVGTRV